MTPPRAPAVPLRLPLDCASAPRPLVQAHRPAPARRGGARRPPLPARRDRPTSLLRRTCLSAAGPRSRGGPCPAVQGRSTPRCAPVGTGWATGAATPDATLAPPRCAREWRPPSAVVAQGRRPRRAGAAAGLRRGTALSRRPRGRSGVLGWRGGRSVRARRRLPAVGLAGGTGYRGECDFCC